MHCLFFFNDTATTEIYTLSLHDALPIFRTWIARPRAASALSMIPSGRVGCAEARSEEHTSELQSRSDLVCRLLLEKKKTTLAATTVLLLVLSRTPVGSLRHSLSVSSVAR